MTKRNNIIFYALTIIFTLAGVFGVAFISSNAYGGAMWYVALMLVAGAIVAGLFNAFAHELGHLIAGKLNGFALSEMVVWCFKWKKEREKISFGLTLIGDQAGYTEMFPTTTDNLEKGYRKMTRGGLIASAVCMLLGIVPMCITGYIPFVAYAFWSMLFPIGIYYVFGNLFPIISGGVKNDGAVLRDFRKGTDSSKVMVNLLAIQAELYGGKTPSEVDEKYYFDLPQLPEDDLNFVLLLNARYAYYVDKEDYENAKKVTARLLELEEYMPKAYLYAIKADALYNACTFDLNDVRADALTYELEKYLNANNNATNVRIKTAYLKNIKGETDGLEEFYEKWYDESEQSALEGLELYEKKLLERLKRAE